MNKILPHDTEAEKTVLGCILQDNQIYGRVMESLFVDDFYVNSHAVIYSSMSDLLINNEPCDTITLIAKLRSKNNLDKVGGASYISELQDNIPSAANYQHYINIIKEKSERRNTIKTCQEIIAKCYDQTSNISNINPLEILPNCDKGHKKAMQKEVEEWIRSNASNKLCYSNVTISLLSCYSDLNLKSPNEKASCRMAFKRLVEKEILDPIPGRSGMYKYINGHVEDIDFLNADTKPYDFKCPLQSHYKARIYPKSVVIIAGEPNSGKTAYLLNLAYRNKEKTVQYFSSEMEATELRIRLEKFNINLHDWLKIPFKFRTENFDEVIDPDGFNIIDYLTVHKDFYEIAGMIYKIHSKLKKGIAVIALQKPRGRDEAVGGSRTLDLARLYLSVSPGIFKIVKAKIWVDPNDNPNGIQRQFKLIGGANFLMSDETGKKYEWFKD